MGVGSDGAWLHVNKQARIILSNQRAWTLNAVGEWLGGVLIVKIAVSLHSLEKSAGSPFAALGKQVSGDRYKRNYSERYKSVPHKSRSQIAYLDEWQCDRVDYQIRRTRILNAKAWACREGGRAEGGGGCTSHRC